MIDDTIIIIIIKVLLYLNDIDYIGLIIVANSNHRIIIQSKQSLSYFLQMKKKEKKEKKTLRNQVNKEPMRK